MVIKVLSRVVAACTLPTFANRSFLVPSFVIDDMASVHRVGHGKAMNAWVTPLPEDPRVDLTKHEHVRLALGFGIVLTPCAVVELSKDPQGGLTRVCLPFLSMWNMSNANQGPGSCGAHAEGPGRRRVALG